ncbi:MAG: shikimate kinase [Desulfosoma sp.]
MPLAQRIALIGFRASGKSTVGPLVAEFLGWTFVDMDEELSRSFGSSIAEWVERFGWERFRDEEAQLLEKLSRRVAIVVATGGGIVEKEINSQRLQNEFFTVWLRCDLVTLQERLATDKKSSTQRPSLTGRHILQETAEILQKRNPWYAASAHLTLHTDTAAPKDLASEIIRVYKALADFDRTVSRW